MESLGEWSTAEVTERKKKKITKYFFGAAMRSSNGCASPALLEAAVLEALAELLAV
jgi:Asp-tRNA(Asn)/Glu-tRNA(Gln) amidotransferase B subunit